MKCKLEDSWPLCFTKETLNFLLAEQQIIVIATSHKINTCLLAKQQIIVIALFQAMISNYIIDLQGLA